MEVETFRKGFLNAFSLGLLILDRAACDHGGEKFAKAILQESHSIWHAMDNGNYVEGFIEMEDFPRAVLKRFKFK